MIGTMQGGFFTGTLQFQYQKENLQAAKLKLECTSEKITL